MPPVEVFARHEPDPGREVTTRSKNLRIRDGRCDRGGSDKTNSGDALEPLARLAQAVLHHDAFLDRSDQRLHRLKLRRQHDKARVSIDRQARIRFASNDLQQFLDPVTPLRSHNAELGQMRPHGIDQLGPLPHQKIARAMQHQPALLLRRFDLYKTHGRASHRLTDRLSISRIILVALDLGLHILRRPQTYKLRHR